MSLYVGASASDYGLKTTGLIDHNAAYTWMAWVELVSDTNNRGTIWAAFGGAEVSSTEEDWLGFDTDGTTIRIESWVSSIGVGISGSSLTVGTPVHITITRESATRLRGYLNGATWGQVDVAVSSRPATQRELIGKTVSNASPIRLTAIKCWQAALTADEIAAEKGRILPVRTANLHSFVPAIDGSLSQALQDYTGNARHWSAQGSISADRFAPPVSWGSRPLLPLPATPQYLAPVSDVSAGSWTPSSGSDLYAMLDETAYSDSDYIAATSATTCTLALASGSDPASSTGHILRYRLLAGSGTVAVTLKQGGTTIASWGPHALIGTTAQNFAQTLTGSEADSITDYSALRVEFTSALA